METLFGTCRYVSDSGDLHAVILSTIIMGYVYITSLVAPASPKHGVKFLQKPLPGEGAPAEEDLTDARVVEMCCPLAQAGTSVVVGPLVLDLVGSLHRPPPALILSTSCAGILQCRPILIPVIRPHRSKRRTLSGCSWKVDAKSSILRYARIAVFGCRFELWSLVITSKNPDRLVDTPYGVWTTEFSYECWVRTAPRSTFFTSRVKLFCCQDGDTCVIPGQSRSMFDT